jgi:hypothetical protein
VDRQSLFKWELIFSIVDSQCQRHLEQNAQGQVQQEALKDSIREWKIEKDHYQLVK